MVKSHIARLTDILEALDLVTTEMANVTLQDLEADLRRRWLVERGIEIISEASRRLPADLKARHPQIPWPKVAGIGNILRHDYQRIAYDVIWRLVRDDLPPLRLVCDSEIGRAASEGGPLRRAEES